MCGITGIYDEKSRLTAIAMMNQVQRHRGPDDEGYLFINSQNQQWQAAFGQETAPQSAASPLLLDLREVPTAQYDLVLASRRLAILDLSPAGHMPMAYGDGKLWVTYNGEIFNYCEIRQELCARGHRFRSDSDTEVLLAAYAEWGVDCLQHFNGMFAFALWDSQRKRLFCTRDRFGIKPFYYYWDGQAFIFASELKSLIQHPAIVRQPDDQAIFDYLTIGVSDHTERTFFKGIRSLQPGHFLLLDMSNKQLRDEVWWEIRINPSIEKPSAVEQRRIYRAFADLLEDSVRIRLRSDVPVGTALSGGLDSSTVTLLANHLLLEEKVIPPALVGAHQKTFTARNHESALDEHSYSRLIIEKTGAEEHVIYPDGAALWQEFDSFVWFLDEPVNSTSQYAQWNVMRLARRNKVTVLLDGQGGDEIFAGYYAYYPPYLSQLYQQRGVFSTMRAVLDISRVGGTPAMDMLMEDAAHRLPWRVQQFVNRIRPPLAIPGGGGSGLQAWQLQPGFMERNWERRWRPQEVDANGLVGVLHRDLTSTNLPKLLRYEDRISMAFSLESRLPYLDNRLIDMVFALPLNYRIHNGWSKWILRRSMSHLLPPEICWRRTKLGFPTPEVRWLTQGAAYIRQRLQAKGVAEQVADYVQPCILKQISEQPDGALAATPGLWRLLNLIVWFDIFFTQSRPAAAFTQPALYMEQDQAPANLPMQ